MRVVGIDLGSRRIGVAVSDPAGILASPYEVVQRGRNHTEDHRRLVEIITELGAGKAVVGLPLSLDGSSGRAAKLVEDEVVELRAAFPVPVELYDERFTTVTAHQNLMERKMKADARRRIVDKVAAAVLLQAWLDSHG